MRAYCGVHSCKLNRKNATKFITFHRINSIRCEQWKNQLILLLGRDFNKEGGIPKYLHICSRHFDEICFTKGVNGQQRLRQGSLPTRFLPLIGDIASPREVLPEVPTGEELPMLDPSVFNDFKDFLNNIENDLPFDWTLLSKSSSQVVIWHEDRTLRMEIKEVSSSPGKAVITIIISYRHECITELAFDLLRKGTKSLIQMVMSMDLCHGIREESLQNLAGFQSDGPQLYHRLVLYVNNKLQSVVRSTKCHTLISSTAGGGIRTLCQSCQSTRTLLLKKQEMFIG